jgi:hypothetical protein
MWRNPWYVDLCSSEHINYGLLLTFSLQAPSFSNLNGGDLTHLDDWASEIKQAGKAEVDALFTLEHTVIHEVGLSSPRKQLLAADCLANLIIQQLTHTTLVSGESMDHQDGDGDDDMDVDDDDMDVDDDGSDDGGSDRSDSTWNHWSGVRGVAAAGTAAINPDSYAYMGLGKSSTGCCVSIQLQMDY